MMSNILHISSSSIATLPFFTVTRDIKVGDILTSLSILISATVLLRAWAKDRRDRNKELADRIRSAAAKTLAKLDRWQELSLWLFQYTQPLFIETSEMLVKSFDVIAARDYFWKKANEARINISGRMLDEEIEVAYVDLYGYHPAVRGLFVKAIDKLKEDEEVVFQDFIESSQDAIRSYDNATEGYQSAQLGNELREIAFHFGSMLKEKTDKTLEPIQEFLVDIISESDAEILKRKRLPTMKQFSSPTD